MSLELEPMERCVAAIPGIEMACDVGLSGPLAGSEL